MLSFEYANIDHQQLLFDWANDEETRMNSFSSAFIKWNDHVEWMHRKLADPFCKIYIFKFENKLCGMVRIEKNKDEIIIGISISKNFRGRGFASLMIEMASTDYLKLTEIKRIIAYIKGENAISKKSFEKAGYIEFDEVMINNELSKKYYYGI